MNRGRMTIGVVDGRSQTMLYKGKKTNIMCFVYIYSVFLTVPAYLQCQDENIQQTGSFLYLRFLEQLALIGCN